MVVFAVRAVTDLKDDRAQTAAAETDREEPLRIVASPGNQICLIEDLPASSRLTPCRLLFGSNSRRTRSIYNSYAMPLVLRTALETADARGYSRNVRSSWPRMLPWVAIVGLVTRCSPSRQRA